MKICEICGNPYRRPITHVKDRHRTPMWEQFFHEHSIRPGYCDICRKSIEESIKKHALNKHLGKAAKEFALAGGLS